MTTATAISYINQLLTKAEADVKEYEARAAVHGNGPDARNVADRIVFHQGQVSGLRHALFALTHGGND